MINVRQIWRRLCIGLSKRSQFYSACIYGKMSFMNMTFDMIFNVFEGPVFEPLIFTFFMLFSNDVPNYLWNIIKSVFISRFFKGMIPFSDLHINLQTIYLWKKMLMNNLSQFLTFERPLIFLNTSKKKNLIKSDFN